MRAVWFVLIMLWGIPVASAAELGSYQCFSSQELETVSASNSGVTINNLILRETTGFMIPSPLVELSFSVVNRSDMRADASVEIFAIDGVDAVSTTGPVLTMSATLPLGVAGGQSENGSGKIYTNPGVLAKAKTFCLRMSIVTK